MIICNRLMEYYSKSTLHCTFFQSLHHGGNDVPDFFKYVAPDYLIYTDSNAWSNATGYVWLANNTKKTFVAGDLIALPYNS